MKVARLQAKIESLEAELNRLRAEKVDTIRNCNHRWTVPTPSNIYTKGYTISGDPPGTMGVDWRGPVYIPPKTEKRWKRTCNVCGHIEYTSQVTQQVEEVPKFD